jgi:hypothetical protein
VDRSTGLVDLGRVLRGAAGTTKTGRYLTFIGVPAAIVASAAVFDIALKLVEGNALAAAVFGVSGADTPAAAGIAGT